MAAALTVAEFRTKFPEFTEAAWTDTQVQNSLDDAVLIHSVNRTASLYCAAHLLTISAETGLDGGSGTVTGEKLGPQTMWYANQFGKYSEWKAFFTTTRYGRVFLTLEARTGGWAVAARVVG